MQNSLQIIKSLNATALMSQEAVAEKLHISPMTVRRIERAAIRKCISYCCDDSTIPELLDVRLHDRMSYTLPMDSNFTECETGEIIRKDSIISLVPSDPDGYTIRTSSGNVYSLSQSAGDQLLGKSKVVKK